MVKIGATIPTKNLAGIKEHIESFPGIDKESVTTERIDGYATDINVRGEPDKVLTDFSSLITYIRENSIVHSYGNS